VPAVKLTVVTVFVALSTRAPDEGTRLMGLQAGRRGRGMEGRGGAGGAGSLFGPFMTGTSSDKRAEEGGIGGSWRLGRLWRPWWWRRGPRE